MRSNLTHSPLFPFSCILRMITSTLPTALEATYHDNHKQLMTNGRLFHYPGQLPPPSTLSVNTKSGLFSGSYGGWAWASLLPEISIVSMS